MDMEEHTQMHAKVNAVLSWLPLPPTKLACLCEAASLREYACDARRPRYGFVLRWHKGGTHFLRHYARKSS